MQRFSRVCFLGWSLRACGWLWFADDAYWFSNLHVGSDVGEDFSERTAVWGVYLEGGLFPFDNDYCFSFLNSIPFLLQPLNDFSALHPRIQSGHVKVSHLYRPMTWLTAFTMFPELGMYSCSKGGENGMGVSGHATRYIGESR